jgi:hypothetical protein
MADKMNMLCREAKAHLATVMLAATLSVAGAGIADANCSTLYALAQEHASDMARRESLDHAGFYTERGPRGAMAENVAVGCSTEGCARDMWMKSPPHRANMMLGGCQAVASAMSKSGRRYWAMEIGGGNLGPVRTAAGHRHGRVEAAAIGGGEFRNFGIDGENAP